MKDQYTAPPRLILACGEAPLGRILSHTLSSLGAEVECVHTHKALVGRILSADYDIIITRFAEPLLESRRAVALLRGCHTPRPNRRTLYVIADRLTAEESVALLERGVSQLFATPFSTTRLGQKVLGELIKCRERCRCTL